MNLEGAVLGTGFFVQAAAYVGRRFATGEITRLEYTETLGYLAKCLGANGVQDGPYDHVPWDQWPLPAGGPVWLPVCAQCGSCEL